MDENDFTTPLITYLGEMLRMVHHVRATMAQHNQRICRLEQEYRAAHDFHGANDLLREIATEESLASLATQARAHIDLIKRGVWSSLFPGAPLVPDDILIHIYLAGVPIDMGLPVAKCSEDLWYGIILMNPALLPVVDDIVRKHPWLSRMHTIFQSACLHDSSYFPSPLRTYQIEDIPRANF